MRHAVVMMVASAALTVTTSAQTTWYVGDDNCPGPGSGTEADPFCSIQDGIDAASNGDDVVVLPGLYAVWLDESYSLSASGATKKVAGKKAPAKKKTSAKTGATKKTARKKTARNRTG